MFSKKCGAGTRICPITLGLALGLTTALAVFLWMLWLIYHGVPPMTPEGQVAAPTMGQALGYTFWTFVKGFFFGFFLALFYDLIAGACRCRACKGHGATVCNCCQKPAGTCACDCGCCKTGANNCSCSCACCKTANPPGKPIV